MISTALSCGNMPAAVLGAWTCAATVTNEKIDKWNQETVESLIVFKIKRCLECYWMLTM